MDAIDLIAELRSETCRCGRRKQSRQTFCRSCYFSLPSPARSDIYKRVGSGYQQAYDAAVALLDHQESSGADSRGAKEFGTDATHGRRA